MRIKDRLNGMKKGVEGMEGLNDEGAAGGVEE